jgi:DNA-directed RNA polymerase subunit RPC12/RpoP
MLKFRCPRCMCVLHARSGMVGKRKRCPRCLWVFPVPSGDEIVARESLARLTGGYGLAKSGTPAPSSVQYVYVSCGVCSTRLSATMDQIGQKLTCPDCGTLVKVPPPPPPAIAEGADEQVEMHEEYTVLDAPGQPPKTNETVYRKYLHLHCSLCGTRMIATSEQVGQSLTCPDCGTATKVETPVAPPPDPAAIRPPEGPDSEYALSPTPGQPPRTLPTVYAPHYSANCPMCRTRLSFLAEDAGQDFACPDCGVAMVVPPPPSDLTEWGSEDVGQYEPPPPQKRSDRGDSDDDDEEDAKDKKEIQVERLPPPPEKPFVTGVYTFPFYPVELLRWSSLAVVGALIAYMATMGFQLAQSRYQAVAGVPMMGFSGVFALLWVPMSIATLLAIVRDTAIGYDRIAAWPEGFVVDWLSDALFAFSSAAAGVLPGLALGVLTGLPDRVHWILCGASVLALAPIFLLSMLEAGTCVPSVSPKVLRTFVLARHAWFQFYTKGTTIAVVAAIILWLTGWHLDLLWIIPQFLLGGVAAVLYARLLGRLGLCCSLSVAALEEREAEAAADNALPPPTDEEEAASGSSGPVPPP